MYCPQCQTEYREGFTECADCHVPLEAGPPPAELDPFDPKLNLAVVLETNNPVQLAMAKGLLEDAAIPFNMDGQIATLVQGVDPFLQKWVRLQVSADREAEARELLAEILEPETAAPVGEEDGGDPGAL